MPAPATSAVDQATLLKVAGARWLIAQRPGTVVVPEMPLRGKYIERVRAVCRTCDKAGVGNYCQLCTLWKPNDDPADKEGFADLFAITHDAKTVRIVEVKITRSDYRAEVESKKYLKYVRWADYFHYLTPPGLVRPGDAIPPKAGLLVLEHPEYVDEWRERYGIRVVRRPRHNHPATDRTALWPRLAQSLFNRYYWGMGSRPCPIVAAGVRDYQREKNMPEHGDSENAQE